MRQILTCLFLVFITTNFVAQDQNPKLTNMVFLGHQTFKLVEGCQEVELPNDLGMLMVIVREAEVVTIKRYKDYRLYELESMDVAAQSMNCSCDYNCWEDYELLQSICICNTCDGGGGSIASDYYLKIEGIEGE